MRSPMTIMASLLGVALVLHAPVLGQEDPPDDTRARLIKWIEHAETKGFSGVVLAGKGGEIIVTHAGDFADPQGAVPNSPDTLFEIASVTKSFTAAAVMVLAQRGKLSLDDPIAKHLPGVPVDCHAITVRHLLGHTSGIPGTNSRGGGDDLSVVLPLFLAGGPVHEPGTRFEYWNQGYALLSEVIARASGQSYTDFCREHLFIPAGMDATRFTGDDPPEGAVVAIGRSSRGQPRSALDHPYGSYGLQYRGMGGIVTSVNDLWAWDRTLRGQNLLSEASKAELFNPGLNDYALGWFVRTTRSGRSVQSHGGGVRGFACAVRRYPLEDGCLFVLCNRDDLPVRFIADQLEAILFDEPAAKIGSMQPPRPLGIALREAVLGKYTDKKGNRFTIRADGQLTRAQVHWSPPAGPVTRALLGLDAEGGVLFIEQTDSIAIEFDMEEGQPAKGLTILGQYYKRAF